MRKTIMVVEDDPSLAEIFTVYLLRAGYMVVEVHTGTEAFRRLIYQKETPDAILLDMHLPGRSGDEIYGVLSQRGLAWRVVICSADVLLINRYRGQGATAITKPVRLEELGILISTIVGGAEL